MYNWWKTFECLLYFCTKNAAESLTHVDLFTFKQSNLNRTVSVDSVCYVSMATLFKTSIQELTVWVKHKQGKWCHHALQQCNLWSDVSSVRSCSRSDVCGQSLERLCCPTTASGHERLSLLHQFLLSECQFACFLLWPPLLKQQQTNKSVCCGAF